MAAVNHASRMQQKFTLFQPDDLIDRGDKGATAYVSVTLRKSQVCRYVATIVMQFHYAKGR